jgi:hypothetical protein
MRRGYLVDVMRWNSRTMKGKPMIIRQTVPEPFAFWLIREFLTSDEDKSEDLQPIDNKEFYSVLAMLIAGVAVLALTIGPFAIL